MVLMKMFTWRIYYAAVLLLFVGPAAFAQEVSIGGFIPFLGMGMTNEYKTFDDVNLGPTFFISDAQNSIKPGVTQLGRNGTPYYDIALLDTGAATHILTQQAFQGFHLEGYNLTGTQTQSVGGATGTLNMTINDAAGVYVAGLGDRTSAGSALVMNKNSLRGQSSFATLTAPAAWTLPNIIGLPMAMHHSIAIRNSEPLVFQHQGRTVRTPQIDLIDVGTGGQQGILRRAALDIRPGIGFVQGPFYVYNLNVEDVIFGGSNLALHDNPSSPTVVQDQTGTGGSLFLDVDLKLNGILKEEREFLFDTGADITVISQHMAKRLGFDAVLDTPDFYLEVEGSGGVASGVPGIFLDELNIVTVGGNFTLQNVPVAILDVTNVSDPGNVLDGIIGTHLFNGRDLVIDAKPSLGAGGVGPSLYISDPVTTNHTWSTSGASAPWQTAGNWNANHVPDLLAATKVINVSGTAQKAVVTGTAQANTLTVGNGSTATIELDIQSGATLTTFGETKINSGGIISVAGGATLDTQFVNIEHGTLRGGGVIFSGTGPINTPVRNINGRVEVGDTAGDRSMKIDGDFSNLIGATIAFDLAGTTQGTGYDFLEVTRHAFLNGTLEVSLQGFTPSEGQSFTLLSADAGLEGTFANLSLPTNYTWDVDYTSTELVLTVTGLAQALEGDFNFDGKVDLADYTVWRDNLGGLYNASHYQLWKTNFGRTSNHGALSQATVPEPATWLAGLVAVAATAMIGTRRKGYGKR